MIRNATLSIIAIVVIVAIVVIIVAFFGAQGNIIKSSLYGKELSAKASQSSFSLIQTIPIPNVNGRIDHMAIDIRGQKLFVAELENNSVDVVDLKAARRINSISNNGLREPQGIIFIPELNRIFVSNGQDGTVDIFDAKSFVFVKEIKLPSNDADNMRYDPNNKLVYVGYGEGSLGVINATDYNIVGDIKLTGHPESFQIEGQKRLLGQQQRIFVNVPESHSIEVVDSQKHMVSTTWPIVSAQNNFPMALDEANHRLFVGIRDPPKLVVFDTNSGKVISILDIAKDPDDIFYDAAKKRIYVSCGEGFVNVFQQQQQEKGKFFIKEMELKRKYREAASVSAVFKRKLIKLLKKLKLVNINAPEPKIEYVLKQNGRLRRHFSLTGLYYHFSTYGESIVKPRINGL